MHCTTEQLMKHEFNSRRLFGITRSKGKMFEFRIPIDSHISVPENSNPDQLFVLTVGTLGDVAAKISTADDSSSTISSFEIDELGFSASFFDAYIESKFSEELNPQITLLAASA